MKKIMLTLLFAFLTTSMFAQIPVTFRVDMGVAVHNLAFNPASDVVVVRGSFQTDAGDPGGDWQGQFFLLTDTDGDTIYTVTANFPVDSAGKAYEYKFVINTDGWEGSPNRPFTLTAPSMTLPVYYYNDDSVYASVVLVTNTINFTADLSTILGVGAGGAFDPSQDSMLVMGLNWDGLGTLISPEADRKLVQDPFTPNIFTTSLTFEGDIVDSTKWKFKAFPDGRFSNTGWETGSDRWHQYLPDGSVTTLPTLVPRVFPLFDALANDVSVTFNVNMSNAVNVYNGNAIDPATLEFVGMRGGADFLGSWASGSWTVSDTTAGLMKVLQNMGNNIWSRTVVVTAGTNGGVYEYKYAAIYPGADTVNGGSSPLDNEGGFGENHSFILVDGPAVVLNNLFGVFVTAVKQVNDLVPSQFSLQQNYPNPFNPSTTIKYKVAEMGLVTMKIYNALGQEVGVMVNQVQNPGEYQVTFEPYGLSSGVYFYTLTSGSFNSTKKMILMK